jgi:hypothetical protein
MPGLRSSAATRLTRPISLERDGLQLPFAETRVKEDAMAARTRERNDTGTDVRYIRRDDRGRFTSDQADVGRSSAADQRTDSKTAAKRGQGDKGDRQGR